MKLQYTHWITDKRLFGKVTIVQQMIIEVDYDPEDDSISDINVSVYQDGKFLCEISKLLDNAEGNPLICMIEAINWAELYHSQKSEVNG